MLSKEAIEEYKILYKEKFGIELTNEEAILRANNLVDLYRAVYSTADFSALKDDREGFHQI